MFCGGELQSSGRIARARKIDHANMFMRGADPVNIEKSEREQSAGSRFGRGWSFAKQFKGIRVTRDSWMSVMYAERLNSAKSSVTLQGTDRHGILG